MVPLEIIENFDTIDDIVSVWTSLFTEILDIKAIESNVNISHNGLPQKFWIQKPCD